MGDINEYILSRIARSFFTNIGLWEIIIDRDVYLVPNTTLTNKKSKQLTLSGAPKEYLSLKVAILPSILVQNPITDSYASIYNTQKRSKTIPLPTYQHQQVN